MISGETIKTHLDKQPFVPLTIIINDGNEVTIRDADLAYITQMELHLYRPPAEGETLPRHLDRIIAITNIATIRNAIAA